MQLTIEMKPADETKVVRPAPKSAVRTYRFDRKPASLVDQVALTTDYKKSEFVADSIKLGAIFVQLAGADALRVITTMLNSEKKCFILETLISLIDDEK